MNRAIRGATWLTLIVGAIVALRAAATGDLTPPPIDSAAALGSWVDTRGPLVTAFALVRFVAELAAWYLLAITALHAVGAVLRLRSPRSLADRLSTPGVTRLVRGALGLGLVTVGAVGADQPASTHRAVAMERSAGAAPSGVTQERVAAGTATMRPRGDHPTGTAWMTPLTPAAQPVEHRPVEAAPSTWRVEQGESFWSIAADVLEQSWHRPPVDREIDAFWRALVEVNRDRLVDGADPDLVFPGQVFEVPAVPAPPTRH